MNFFTFLVSESILTAKEKIHPLKNATLVPERGRGYSLKYLTKSCTEVGGHIILCQLFLQSVKAGGKVNK
jgi:hypothetical protein